MVLHGVILKILCLMLAILSDIHSNFPALKAVVADAISKGCTRFLSLGDVGGYGAQPGECIDLLKEIGAINILGNHDSYLLFDENCSRSRVVSKIINYQKKIISAEHIAWLRSSLRQLRKDDFLFVHGGPDDPQDQYLYTVSASLFPQGIRCIFSGHTHVQIMASFDMFCFCNPGSVGQPRDGDPRAAYALLSSGEISLYRVSYDIDQSVAAMKAAGFEAFCYENLYKGTQIGGRIDSITII